MLLGSAATFKDEYSHINSIMSIAGEMIYHDRQYDMACQEVRRISSKAQYREF